MLYTEPRTVTKQTSELFYARVESPVGPLLLSSDGAALVGLYMSDLSAAEQGRAEWRDSGVPEPSDLDRLLAEGSEPGVITEAREQLAAYFDGKLTRFDLPLAPEGTPFQLRVWEALLEIPYGTTTTYGELARLLGNPGGSRAVGLANGRNPIGIIIPCHRVIGANGKLTGYGGGLPRKAALLDFEFTVMVNGPHPFPRIVPA